jgi:hypothetical protein
VAALLGVARAQELSGSTEQALRTQREALAAARALDDPRTGVRLQAQVLVRMAEALERAGDPAGARAQREQAAALGLPASRGPVHAGAAEVAAVDGACGTGAAAEVTPPVME